MSAVTGLDVLILTRNVSICQEHLDVNVKMATSNYRMGTVKVCMGIVSSVPHIMYALCMRTQNINNIPVTVQILMSVLPTQVYARKMKNVSINREDILVSVNKVIGEMIEEIVKVH